MTYPESVRYLYSLGNELRSAKFGLEGISRLLRGMGDPQRDCRCIHVAGTNGKGSTCAFIESALRVAGYRTGLYTSPHLAEPTERIRINGAPVSREMFADAFDHVHGVAEQMLRDEMLVTHPTYFETVTGMAFHLFRREEVDYVVLETGLGGRLDATNVVFPVMTAITPVDFDHEQFLGKTLEAIAGEKAGILKPGVPVVLSPQREQAAATILDRAAAIGARPVLTSGWQVTDLELNARGSRFRCAGSARLEIECPLAGEHQVTNALTAIGVLHELGVPGAAIEEGIRRTRWPGRLERVEEQPEVILDGAHNPSGARALAAYVNRFYRDRQTWLVLGAMRDKSADELVGLLVPVAQQVILTAPSLPRAVRPEILLTMTDHPNVRVAPALSDALRMLEEVPVGDMVLITGSLFLVGEARALLAPAER